MLVAYNELKNKPKFNIDKPIFSLIANNHWFLFSFDWNSVYFGYWISVRGKIYKILEKINIYEEIDEIEIINEKKIKLICKKNEILLFLDSQGFNFIAVKPTFIDIDFDFRKIYETDIKENNFRIVFQENNFIIFFEDLDINLFYEGDLKYINEKIKVNYNYDFKRKSIFYQNTVFKLFKGWLRSFKIFSSQKEIESESYINNHDNFESFISKRIFSLFSSKENEGFMAGLPWFPQKWFRDELISLLFLDDYSFFKSKIFSFYLDNLENIWQYNKSENYILAADTLLLLINNLDEQIINKNKNALINLLKKWENLFNILNDNLPPQSTWMDTIERKRAIEIDFLYYLSLLKLGLIPEAKKFKIFIKNKIFSKVYPSDEFLRPNLFFAYFLDKKFFEPEEWEFFFDNLINNNYLDWGGFSSISKYDDRFRKTYSGEPSDSYHQGDSWFWLNNLSYFSLNDLNSKKYNKYLKKIRQATMKNLLKIGVPGYISELSSAEKLRYEGSPIQLWSLTSLLYNIKLNIWWT
ncbi:MAG: hypothetical protein KatS3mg095_0243 [Candidatus Parcubacteria bacterium]|nr:MAG: hypothetical protein KatS3mg095_0243 [Candidatus Parcubacteria bacterium]